MNNQSASCQQCGTEMNPVEAMLGPVCGICCRKNQTEIAGNSSVCEFCQFGDPIGLKCSNPKIAKKENSQLEFAIKGYIWFTTPRTYCNCFEPERSRS